MKKAILFVAVAIITISGTAFADVKIKSRQTMSGQVTENTTYIKGKRSRTEMMNGTMISVTQCDLSRDLQINPNAKTYMVNLYDDGNSPAAGAVKAAGGPVVKGGTMYITTNIRDTGERKQMFGFTARHIIQTMEMESSPDACNPYKSKLEMDMWVIDAEFSLDCLNNRRYVPRPNAPNGGCTDKMVAKTTGTGKSGYPVYQRMTSFDANGKESYTMIQEVVELSRATLDASLFEAPADYREVSDPSTFYAAGASSAGGPSTAASTGYDSGSVNSNPSRPSSSGLGSSINKAASAPAADGPAAVGAKKPGTVRIGLANVKTGSVGEGISAADLGTAVRNSLGEFLKGTKIEVINLEAKLPSAAGNEAKEKECDYVVYATVSHKKGGGGGFGGFGKMLGSVVSQTGIGHTGSVAGNIAGQLATTAIVTAASVSGNVKKKDELNLEMKVQSAADNSPALAKQFKAKAESDGDDIISTVVEQAAQAIIDAIGK